MADLSWVANYDSESILEKDSLAASEFLYLGKTRHYAEEVGLEELRQDVEERMVEYLGNSPETLPKDGLNEDFLPMSAEEALEVASDRERRLVYADMSVYDVARDEAESHARELNSAYVNMLIHAEGIAFEGAPLVPEKLAVE